jgi:antitoxin (DNA-binding transcriptional repressor) of toxin-antitoxin stability system
VETRISATELARRLSDVLSRAHYRGERFVVERGGETVAILEPPGGATRSITLRELAARLRNIRPDDRFADDLEAIQAEQPASEPPAW